MRYDKSTLQTSRAMPLRLITLALLVSGLAFGCVEMRKTSYPSDFVYLERKTIKSEMALFSMNLQQLDEILLDNSTVSSEQQERVLAILNRIYTGTETLGAGSVRTNHLVIDENIDQFRSEVNDAIRNARASPPNYFALGRLSGACIGCHKYRD